MDHKEFFSRAIFPSEAAGILKKYRDGLPTNAALNHLLINPESAATINFDDELKLYRDRYIAVTSELHKNKEPELLHSLYQGIIAPGPFYLNYNAFLSTIMLLGDEEQTKYWKDLIINNRVVGAYAQTEIGHGSDVQSLETTAHFDEKTQTFILNSPKVTSAKMWPGLMGIFSTHVVMQAKTYVKDQKLGIQTFVVQIRDPKTYKIPDGVEVGDQGPKLGFEGVDNGYLKFTNYRQPLKSMLAKYSKVYATGEVKIADANSLKYTYGSMLNLRVQLVRAFGFEMGKSAAIAYYQGLKDKSSMFLGDLTRADKVLRGIGFSFAFITSSSTLDGLYGTYLAELEKKDKHVDKTLNQIHILSASQKAYSGWVAMDTIRDSLTLSPIGYLHVSLLPQQYVQNVPIVTYEGDNSVLCQLTARFLLKEIQKLLEGKHLSECTGFLSDCHNNGLTQPVLATREDFQDLRKIEKALNYLFYHIACKTAQDFGEKVMGGTPLQTVWNEMKQVDLIKMTVAFAARNTFSYTLNEIEKADLLPNIKQTLLDLTLVVGLNTIEDYRQQLSVLKIVPENFRAEFGDVKKDKLTKLLPQISLFVEWYNVGSEQFFSSSFDKNLNLQKKTKEIEAAIKSNYSEVAKALLAKSAL